MLLLSLIAIALFITGGFIRSTLGDVLVVIWLYCFLSSFINLTYRILIPASVLVAFVVEIAQYFKVAELLGIEPDTLLSIIFGATFDWGDMVAYIVGGCVCLVVERLMKASVSVH
ncbi:DUF2809 domain-containing protein [Shewanella schlegeliana]|uniref:DUF2809 domain-containing protein n=1 Tax=Shewanella schlegeliana TaxID=190308 RepID=A0ABS1T0T5_9GAMM|nr:DUF2809 domain-containing protein [Shewanella schlegeliana]MBL4913865.1 DUF2809 domain-containing protein [Shewanella schlegeliana]MCL1108751.1 DUF2809 domain-containing protein [Shewanella schlegeliana]GIU26193.1 membrane protein [Shewanella schlegeliana]